MATIEFLNLSTILYLGFRLGPFILVSYFVISSIFNSDIRGIMFLALLLFNCFATILLGNFLDAVAPGLFTIFGEPNKFGKCNSLNLTQTGPLSKILPLNINVFGFTFGYLAQIIQRINDKSVTVRNVPMMIAFSSIILYQLYWMVSNNCASFVATIVSLSCGFGIGWLLSWLIDINGIADMQYFNGIKNQDVCTKMSDEVFACTTENTI